MSVLVKACFVLSMLGLGLEVIFTGVWALIKGKPNVVDHCIPMGYTSPLYVPTYMTTAILFYCFGDEFFKWHFLLRFLFYSGYSFVLEYTQNLILKLILGQAPSEKVYSATGHSINGMVIIYYPFIFGIAGFLFEWVFQAIHLHSISNRSF